MQVMQRVCAAPPIERPEDKEAVTLMHFMGGPLSRLAPGTHTRLSLAARLGKLAWRP